MTVTDRIVIRELKARCIIGTEEEERRERQDVSLDLVLFTDLRKPGASDDLADAVDYRALKKKVLAMVERSRCRLVEALAEAVAALCLESAAVTAVEVRVEKPGALRFARTVGVEIRRERS